MGLPERVLVYAQLFVLVEPDHVRRHDLLADWLRLDRRRLWPNLLLLRPLYVSRSTTLFHNTWLLLSFRFDLLLRGYRRPCNSDIAAFLDRCWRS